MYPEFRSDVCKICKPRAFVLQLQLQDAAVDITRQPKLAAQVAREIACEAEKGLCLGLMCSAVPAAVTGCDWHCGNRPVYPMLLFPLFLMFPIVGASC